MSTFAMPQPSPVVGALLTLAASRRATVELTLDRLTVRLGHTWHTTIPRSSLRAATPVEPRGSNVGAHGWGGRWLVNTANTGLVRLEIHPAATGTSLGLKHTLGELTVSLADPEAFLQELAVSAKA